MANSRREHDFIEEVKMKKNGNQNEKCDETTIKYGDIVENFLREKWVDDDEKWFFVVHSFSLLSHQKVSFTYNLLHLLPIIIDKRSSFSSSSSVCIYTINVFQQILKSHRLLLTSPQVFIIPTFCLTFEMLSFQLHFPLNFQLQLNFQQLTKNNTADDMNEWKKIWWNLFRTRNTRMRNHRENFS